MVQAADGATSVLTLSGALDGMTAWRLRHELTLLLIEGTGQIVLDLLAVRFMDTSGLSALVAGHRRCRELGGNLHLVADGERFHRQFDSTGRVALFRFFSTAAAACGAFP